MSVTPFPYVPERAASSSDRAHAVVDLLPTYLELAGRIANTEFVPTALRRRPEAVLAALLSGAERGLGPMESLRSVHVIEGRPSLSAEAMRALVLAAGHDIDIVESTAQRATVVGRRAGSDSTSPPFTWTLDRARRARLAGKDNWVKYPEAMLLARASTDLCRAVFPDVIAGLASTEEVLDETTGSPSTTSRRAPARRTPAIGGAPVPAPEIVAAPDQPVVRSATAGMAPGTGAAASSAELDTTPRAEGGSVGTVELGDLDALLDDEPEPANLHDAGLARRIHAEITKAFPDVPAATRDRWRHALVAVVTRKRPAGPVTSSTDLDYAEQLRLSDLLAQITGNRSTITDEPDDTIELRAGGGWRYTITLDPLTIAVRRGDDTATPDEDTP